MAEAGVFIAWDKVAVGREKQAMTVWADALTFYEKAQANGEIERYEIIGFQGSSSIGLLGGISVRGSEEAIEKFMATPEFTRQMQRASLVVDHLHTNRFVTGGRMGEIVTQYFQEVDSLLG